MESGVVVAYSHTPIASITHVACHTLTRGVHLPTPENAYKREPLLTHPRIFLYVFCTNKYDYPCSSRYVQQRGTVSDLWDTRLARPRLWNQRVLRRAVAPVTTVTGTDDLFLSEIYDVPQSLAN